MKSMALLILIYFNIESFIFVFYCAVSFAIFLQFRKPYVELMKLIVFIMIISSAEESPCINTIIHITMESAFTIAHIAHCSEKRSRYRKLATTDTTVVRESMNGRFPPIHFKICIYPSTPMIVTAAVVSIIFGVIVRNFTSPPFVMFFFHVKIAMALTGIE